MGNPEKMFSVLFGRVRVNIVTRPFHTENYIKF